MAEPLGSVSVNSERGGHQPCGSKHARLKVGDQREAGSSWEQEPFLLCLSSGDKMNTGFTVLQMWVSSTDMKRMWIDQWGLFSPLWWEMGLPGTPGQ